MKTKYKFLLLVVLAITVSCSDYLDVNDNPNSPSADDVTPDLILAGAMSNTYRTQARSMNRLGNVMMNNWGANVNSYTGGFAEEFSLAINNNFYNDIFTGLYRGTYNFQAIIDYEGDAYNNHKAISKIMKSFYMQYVVDLYGDVPYFEAHQGIKNLTPAYDNDRVVYEELYKQVTEAIDLINAADANTIPVGSEDIIFNGSMSSWIAFGNSLRLRILLRQTIDAESGDAESLAFITSKFPDLQTVGFLNNNAAINPGYSNGSTAQQNPFYNLFGFSNNETTSTGYNFYRASKYAVDFLTNTGDDRLNRLYDKADDGSGVVVGHEQGADSDNSPAGLSPLGEGVLINSAQDGYVMTAAESLLMQSEAQLKGYIPGDPKASFEAAVTASFQLLGADESGYDTDGLPAGIGWTGTPSDQFEAIMRQKWIATNGVNAIESYIEFTRTGFPDDIPLALTAQSSTRPKRLMYPSDEYISNSANVPAQVSADVFATGPFWAQ
ncbi:SusD/RagB family nutrient-binding outer membrane lipoprotein [Bizionia myxarmorum]|uniref:SusD/RagB family nutrient-binding outer membrane lipoprotein n=1 Tax=Bizionia myxarmorum TaxID=291186 RepID=A0A5D0RCV8_9FLAO|nr:SusD/RagB family nutrient-binding outer membrane lipoprotein [Bizionia myxarmorum]TYB79342.1 SusD/RagB family nutrient-binding outer membrane lipoprotein [Bizionia myxarmorum]